MALIRVKTEDELRALCDATAAVHGEAHELLRDVMTLERCREVRKLRIDEGLTWRGVAAECHQRWGASWEPPSNQLWGIALCEIAARAHSENPHDFPWN